MNHLQIIDNLTIELQNLIHNCPLLSRVKGLFALTNNNLTSSTLTRSPYAKKWEQEKIAKFGLSSLSAPPNRHLNRSGHLALWEQEKIAYFGLANPKLRKMPVNDYSTIDSESFTETQFSDSTHYNTTSSQGFLKELGF
ncbi:MAG: hypothetical protein RL637_890 [Pseudomonadota bacterium]|jgi:hypothetical protein